MHANVHTMTAAELNEVLVDLDAVFQKFDAGDPLTCERYMKARTFNAVGIYSGTQVVVEGEPAKVGHVLVSDDAYLTFRFHSPNPDGFGYASFDLINTQLKDMFPGVWKALYEYLAKEYGASVSDVAAAIQGTLRGKPQIIELANKAISNGRMMRTSEVMEVAQELIDVGYEADQEYGQF